MEDVVGLLLGFVLSCAKECAGPVVRSQTAARFVLALADSRHAFRMVKGETRCNAGDNGTSGRQRRCRLHGAVTKCEVVGSCEVWVVELEVNGAAVPGLQSPGSVVWVRMAGCCLIVASMLRQGARGRNAPVNQSYPAMSSRVA